MSPADYARNHWRKFESPEDHARRVEAAEREAGSYFAAATKPQQAAYHATTALLGRYSGEAWDRRRDYARAVWNETTAGARELFEITADEIMRDGEMSDATCLAWDVLTDLAQHAPPPAAFTVVTADHGQRAG